MSYKEQIVSFKIKFKEMKNKKKPSSQTHSKHQSKYDRHEPAFVLKKSPIKSKFNQPKTQTQTSLQGNNLHQFNKTTLFYGKKYHYNQLNPKLIGDSNQSSTHCSFNNRSSKQKSHQNKKNKSKSLKGIKNQQLRHEQIQEEDEVEIRLNSAQIMELINSYAAKIQRQWRRYWFRKCLRFIIFKERQRKKYETLNNYYRSDIKSVQNGRFSQDFQLRIPQSYKEQNDKKRHTLPKLPLNNQKRKSIEEFSQQQKGSQSYLRKHQQTSNDNQLSQQFYNNKKYASLSSIYSGKLISIADISAKNKQPHHDRTSSLGQNIQLSIQNHTKSHPKSPQMVQIGFNCSLNQLPQNHAHLSTPVNGLREIQDTTQKKSSEKKSNIKLQTKVFECKVQQVKTNIQTKDFPKKSQQLLSKNLIEQFKKVQKPSPNINSGTSLNNKYDTKFPSSQNLQKGPHEVTKIFKKYKKAIQKEGNKKISKIMKHFEQKQITQRTYKNLIQQTNQKLSKQIKTLQLKEGHFKNSWKEIYAMYKDFVRENSFQQGETPRNNNQRMKQAESHNDEHSISFDKWDFESSAKKSISQLESFQDFARQLNERNPQKLKGFFVETKKIFTDNKPIELVLDELDRLENDGQKQNSQVSEFKQEGGSIYEEFKRRERTSSFQKKNQHVLVENIAQKMAAKISYAKIKSPHVSPRISPKQAQIPVKINASKSIPDQQEVSYHSKNQHIQAKKAYFEFPQISTPPKSEQRQDYRKEVYQRATGKSGKSRITENIKTDESEEDSQVEMKVTSIQVGQIDQKIQKGRKQYLSEKQENELFLPENEKQNLSSSLLRQVTKQQEIGLFVPENHTQWLFVPQNHNQQRLFVPENHKEKLQNCLMKRVETKKQLQKLEQMKKARQERQRAIELLETLADKYYKKRIIGRLSAIVKQLEKLMTESYRERQKRKQQQQMELKKYPRTIDATIDAINSWLLEISHHLLDHHNAQIKKNLTSIKQLPRQQLMQICHSGPLSNAFFQTHSYITITQKVFKEFQFFYLKNVAHNLEIQSKHQHYFQHLMYGFHRCLIDSMNLTLLDELIIGRNWVIIPWINTFRYKKNQTPQHTKHCLQRAINRVSGWAEYSLAQLDNNTDPNQVNQLQWKQYQQEKMNIVIKQEVLQFPLENQFVLSNLILQISHQLYQDEILLAAKQLVSVKAIKQQ